MEASFKFLSPTPTQVVWHQDQAGLIPNSCPGSAHYYGTSDAGQGVGGTGGGDGSQYRDQVSTAGAHVFCVVFTSVERTSRRSGIEFWHITSGGVGDQVPLEAYHHSIVPVTEHRLRSLACEHS